MLGRTDDSLRRMESEETASVGSFQQRMLSIEQVGQFLLSKNLHLTALELLVESEEIGLGGDNHVLREFFHDKSKFSPQELLKFQGEDVISGQSMAREREERLGVAEYELRVAQEDNRELIESLEKAQGQVAAITDISPTPDTYHIPSNFGDEECQYSPAKREINKLNWGVLAHLLYHGYKVTAMTLQEEAQGQIDSSDSSGKLDSNSLPLWQHYRSAQGAQKAKEHAEAALKEQASLEDQLNDFQRRYRLLQEKNEAKQRENQMLRSEIHILEQKLEARRVDRSTDELDRTLSTKSNDSVAMNSTPVPPRETQDPPNAGDPWLGKSKGSGFGVYGPESALLLVASAIPNIVPNVLINKREDLVPVIIALVQEHPNPSERDRLCNLLFNLIKRPNSAQRQVIVQGCVALAKAIGMRRTAEELLPQCWEQVNHKYAERRTLVANVTGFLVDYVDSEMRSSLVVSILEQLCTDEDTEVRLSSLNSCMKVLDAGPELDRYRAFQELLLNLAIDTADDVAAATLNNLLPVFLNWIWETDKLYTELIPGILQKILSLLTSSPFSVGTDHQLILNNEAELHTPRESQQQKILSLIVVYCKLLPVFRTIALRDAPDWAAVELMENDESVANLEDGTKVKDDVQMEIPVAEAMLGSLTIGTEVLEHPLALNSEPDEPLMESGTDPCNNSPPTSRDSVPPSDLMADQPETYGETDKHALEPHSVMINSSDFGQSALGVHLSEFETGEAFGRWVDVSDHEDWAPVEAIAQRVIPLLVSCIRSVSPVHECKKIRKKLIASLKLTCGVLGEVFTSRVIEPVFLSSSGMPIASCPLPVPAHVAELVDRVKPHTPEGIRVGHTCVLPALLAGVLPQGGKDRLTNYVRGLFTAVTSNETWTLKHKKEALNALQFAGMFKEASVQLLALFQDLVKSTNGIVKRGSAILAEALIPILSFNEVVESVLPGIGLLSSYWDVSVQVAGMEAMESIARHCVSDGDIVKMLHVQYEKLISEGVHEVQLAGIRGLTASVAGPGFVHMEFLLKQVLLLLARVHQKSTAGKSYLQLQEMALTIFHALRTLDGCEINDHRVRLYFIAAMESLERESQLLDPTQRHLISTMLKDHSDKISHLQPAQVVQQQPPPTTKRTRHGSDGSSERSVNQVMQGRAMLRSDSELSSNISGRA